MLSILRNNSPFAVIFLFIFALVVKIQVLLHPQLPVMMHEHFMYNYVLRALSSVFGRAAFAYTLLAVIMIFIQSLYLNSIALRHKLFPRNSYLTAFTYLLLTSMYPRFNFFSETLILNWLLMGATDIMFSFSQTTQPRKHIYNAGLLFSLAALFQFTSLAFLLLLLVGMVLFRSFSLGEWSVALLGYTTPIYFLVSILFLFNKLYLFRYWPHVGFSISPVKKGIGPFIGTMSGLFVLMTTGIYAMQKNVQMSNIYVRRDWIALSFYLIISIVVGFLTDRKVASAWMITLPAVSIIVTHALALEKNKRFSNFIFYFSLLFLAFCLWLNK